MSRLTSVDFLTVGLPTVEARVGQSPTEDRPSVVIEASRLVPGQSGAREYQTIRLTDPTAVRNLAAALAVAADQMET